MAPPVPQRRPCEVTVVVPTLNRPELLRLALASALAQQGVTLEVVVVDDGSRLPVTPAAGGGDPRLRVIRHNRSRGMGAARNAGLAAADGAFVAFLDDDDVWAPDKLARQLRAIRERDAVLAYTGAVAVARDGTVAALIQAPAPGELALALLARNVMPAGSSNVLARADVLRGLGGFDATLPHFSDWDLWIRLAGAGPSAAVPAPLVAYRLHPGNRSVLAVEPLQVDFDRIAARYRAQRAAAGVAIDRVDFGRFLAWGLRQRGRRLAAAGLYARLAVRERDLGSLARAAGTLLGERAMALGAGRPAPPPLPAWAGRYLTSPPSASSQR